jgi:uncharacterized delta-60 repeat protein
MFSKLRRVLVALSIIAASSAAVKVAYAAESDGTVDLGFGSSGVVSLSGTQYKNQLELSTGKVVMFAEVESDSNSAGPDSIKIVSLNADGTMNNSFGTSGILNIQVSTFSYYQFEKAVADSSGGFYLAFYANDLQSGFSRMARITSAGVVDTNFGTNGVVTIPKQQASGSVKSINVDASTGNIYAFSQGSQTEIVRLTAAGALDSTFNADSYQDTSLQPWPGSGFCSSMWRVSIVDVWVDASESYAMVYALKEGPTNTRVLGVAKYVFSTETCDTTFGGDLFASNGSTRTPDSSPDGFYEYAFGGAQNPSAKTYVQDDGSVFGLLKNDAGALYVAKFTAAGLLDSNFGTGGKTIDISGNFGSAWGMTYALAVAPNGAITVVGPPSGSNFATLVRLFSYGAIDIGFGSSGTVSVPTCTNVNYQGALRLSDGSIIAVSGMGSGSYPNTVYTTYVVKLGSGGSSSQCGTTTTTTQPNYGGVPVGGGGNTCSSVGTSLTPSSRTVSGNVGEALTVPAPVAAGFSSPPTYTRVNGSYWPTGLNLDSSTGVVSGTPAMSAQYMTSSITVASGSQTCSYNITWNITAPACVTGAPTIGGTNPTLDTSFGTGGAIAFATTGIDNVLQGGVATSDGNLVVAESFEVSGDPVIKFRKYSPAGTLVSSFGTGGVLTIDKSSGTSLEEAHGIAELSDGSLIAIYTVRTFGMSSSTQQYLLKLTSNGAIDTSFGTNGYGTISTSPNTNVRNLEVLTNGSVIVLVSTYGQGATINELKKFTSTGVADSAFGTSGTLTLSQSEYDFAVNSADSIFVGGSTSGSSSSATVKKYTSAGVLDTAWATSGVVTLTGVGSQGDSLSVMSVATDASNKIYVAVRASTMQSMNSTSKLFRLLADGTNDSSFGSGTLLSSPSSPYVQEILVLADGNVVLSSMNMGMTPEAGVSLVSSSGVLDSSHATNTASLAFGNCALSDARIAQLTTGEVMAFGATYVNSGDSTGSLWKLNFSGVTGGSGSGSNTGTGSNTETPSGAAAPTLVTSANAAALVRAPGSESIIINGEEVVIESNTVNIPAARTPAAQRTAAQVASIQQAGAALLQQFLASLPAGATSTVTVVNTATGAVMQNLVFDANGNSVNVPVEDIVFLDGPQLSLMIGSDNANITSDGKYQIGAGGIVGVTGSGLGVSASGEIIAMSTPTLLANFQTTAAGDFNQSATLPSSIGVGDHTLVVASGSTYAMMGIRVVPSALPTTGATTDRVVIIALFTLVFGALFFRGRRTFAL